MKRQMRDEFLKYDQAAMIEKFGLRSDDGNICITFYGTEYAVDRNTGGVLCYSKPHCKASGPMVNMGSLSTIQGGSMKREGDGRFGRYEAEFDQKDAALSAARAKLGGMPGGRGDAAIAFPCFPSWMSCCNTGIPTTNSRRPFNYSWMPERPTSCTVRRCGSRCPT